MINTPVLGLVPSPAPQEAALHPQAVQVRADQPADPHAMLSAFEQLLDGYAADADAAAGAELIALVVGTSGSTGTPKRTALTARALAASTVATERFFGSNSDAASQWLLALPAHYIAGAQVLARSVLAGTAPVIARSVIEPVHFSPEVFLQAVERMSSARRFISLVPTQLHKLLESADANPHLGAEIHEALGSFTGILLGGAPASADLLAAATALGLNTVTTYGSAETPADASTPAPYCPACGWSSSPKKVCPPCRIPVGNPHRWAVFGSAARTSPAATLATPPAPPSISSPPPTAPAGTVPTTTACSAPQTAPTVLRTVVSRACRCSAVATTYSSAEA